MDTSSLLSPGKKDRSTAILSALSLLAVLLQLIPNLSGGYGYFIDEWYYMACARRLAFGYVDHPPLAPLLLGGVMWLAGSSISVIRLLPALAGGAIVFVTGMMAKEMGGKTFAQGLAALSAMLSPGVLVACGFFSVNAFEILFWVLCSYLFLKLLKTDDPARWLAIGITFGLGLENKHTMVLLGFAFAGGMLLTPARNHFAYRSFWLGLVLAFLIALPNLIWQIMNGWPSLEFYGNATLYKNLGTPPLRCLLNQALLQNPLAAPVWMSGAAYLLFSQEGNR
jgi:4-amino-4-deoxy-L-arabinose transferase-like glycosyltransferase